MNFKITFASQDESFPLELGEVTARIVPADPDLQDKTVTPTEQAQTVTCDPPHDGLGTVTVNRIPPEYVIPDLQSKSVTPMETAQTVTADAGKTGLSAVEVGAIPPEYVIPSGTVQITANGQHDVSGKAVADVAVYPPLQTKTITPTRSAQTVEPDSDKYGLSAVEVGGIPSEYVIPTGTVNLSSNGQHDVSGKAVADVHVEPVLQRKSVTPTRAAQTVEPDSGKDGLSAVDVGGIPSEYVIPSGTVTLSSNGQHDVSGKAVAAVDVQPLLQSKSVTPTRAAQTVTPDSGKDGLSAVEVGGIPSEYVIPEGTKQIAANGTHDVSGYASAQVAVPGPSGSVSITENGTHDVTDYASAVVAVPGIVPTGQIEITQNGTVDVAAFASALVNVAGGGGASNVVTGKITITVRGNMELPSNYSGNGYPILIALERNHANTKGILCAVVAKMDSAVAPQYAQESADAADIARAAYNTSVNYSGTNTYVYGSGNPASGIGTWLRIQPGNKIMVFCGDSGSNMLTTGATYNYVILYSE